jgi:DNA-binding transcriptional MocR family regulator
MALQLGLSVGTISKAYSEAESRGLISGEVGRGTFVMRRRPAISSESPASTLNLALNVPPHTGEDELIASILEDIVADGALKRLLGYLPHQGLLHHRDSMVGWLAQLGMPTDADHLFITHGGQHGLSIALGMVTNPNEVVLTERFSYSGMIALSAQNGYRLHGVDCDKHGLLPDALDRAFTETKARVLFSTPTLQTPTGTTMPNERREEIAEVIRRYDAYLVEDDAYAFLFPAPQTDFSSSARAQLLHPELCKVPCAGSAHCRYGCARSIPGSRK